MAEMVGGILRSLPIVRQMRRRDRMSRKAMLDYQTGRFRELLKYVWPRSAFYREHFFDHGIRETHLDQVTPADLPLIDKSTLMENFDRAVTDPAVKLADVADCRDRPERVSEPQLKPYFLISTSGSTGEPAMLVHDRSCWLTTQVAFAVRLIHRRGRRTWIHRRAYCGGSYLLGAGAMMTRARPRFAPAPLILSLQSPIQGVVEELNRFKPTLLTGFSSQITALAREALDGRLRIDPEVVGTSGENLTPGMEDDIEEAWPGRQVNAYSASESLCMMARRYRQPFTVYDDLNVLQVVDRGGTPVAAGETGEIVITSLHNRILPFIRYRMMDLATQCEEPSQGPFSIVQTILGRDRDAIPVIRDDGTQGEIPAVSLSGSGYLSTILKQFRVVLTAPDLVEIHYIASEDLDEIMLGKIQRALQRSGASQRMRGAVKRVSELPLDPKTNKVRFTEVLCDLGEVD